MNFREIRIMSRKNSQKRALSIVHVWRGCRQTLSHSPHRQAITISSSNPMQVSLHAYKVSITSTENTSSSFNTRGFPFAYNDKIKEPILQDYHEAKLGILVVIWVLLTLSLAFAILCWNPPPFFSI